MIIGLFLNLLSCASLLSFLLFHGYFRQLTINFHGSICLLIGDLDPVSSHCRVSWNNLVELFHLFDVAKAETDSSFAIRFFDASASKIGSAMLWGLHLWLQLRLALNSVLRARLLGLAQHNASFVVRLPPLLLLRLRTKHLIVPLRVRVPEFYKQTSVT